MCMFICYPKGTRGGIFYNPKEKKVIVSTHTFLEEDYMNNFKPRSKVVLKELDLVQDPKETLSFPPLFLVDVQGGEYVQHVLEGE